jgi:DNA-binding response OmpR family regulator
VLTLCPASLRRKGWSTTSPDSQKTILLAEDEEHYRGPLLALLQKSGYNVIVAVDGLEALQKARDYKGEIHLLLSDLGMPRMTGIELATQLSLERLEMGVLLISGGSAGMLVLNHGWQLLPKPSMFQALKQTIEAMLNDKPRANRDPADFGSPLQ